MKLKISVTDKQLQRTSEALIHDIHASREYTEETLTGIDEEETLQEDKLGRWALLLPDIETKVVTQRRQQWETLSGIDEEETLQDDELARCAWS